MLKLLSSGFVLLFMLAGCGEDANPVLGEWRGGITEEQRNGLLLPKGEMEGILVAAFSKTIATLNGQTYQVAHKRNQGTYYVNEVGTNRTMAVQFQEPDKMKLGIPHRFKSEIVVLFMTRIPKTGKTPLDRE